MKPLSRSRTFLLSAVTLVGACSNKSDDGQSALPQVGGDAEVTRNLAKLDAGPDGAKDASGDGNGAGQSDGGDAPVAAPIITVEVDPRSLVPPKDGGASDPLIVPSTYGPAPYVSVTVVSTSGDLKLDQIATVTAAVYEPSAATPLSTTKLARSDASVTPESDTMRFAFSGVPLDLSKLPTGSYQIVFTATTVGGATGSSKVTLAVDAGPVLLVKLPVEGASYKGSAPVEVQATQSSFAVTQVTMALGQGEAVPLTPTGDGTYKGNIDFAAFTPPLEGAQLATFRARNANGTESVVLRKFVSDNAGPTISATLPAMGAMIGNVITIKATVDDPAGVDARSVIAIVGNGNQNFEVALVAPEGTKVYSSLFDTTKLPSYALYPTISFRARDRLGNESTTSYMLSLDNEPPLLDLDPGYIRVIRETDGTCSWPFDPVGPDAVDDGERVSQLFDVRARIEDRGNRPLTGDADFVLIGGIDASTTKLYVLGKANRPLVVDTSDPPDGFCDDINPELVPTSKPQTELDAQVLDMLPLSPQGKPDYSFDPESSCSLAGKADAEPPKAFCDTTENLSKVMWDNLGRPHSHHMTSVMSYNAKNLPAIYTLGPVVADRLQCAGRQFDSSNNLQNGWACLAVKASDTLGNAQVSRPLRVCVVANPAEPACAEYQSLTRLIPSDPLEITTSKPLLAGGAAIVAGAEVVVTGVKALPAANGNWKVDPLDDSGTRFALRGSTGRGPKMCICKDATCTAYSSCPSNRLRLTLTVGQPIVVETASPHGFSTETLTSIVIRGYTEQLAVEGKPWVVTVIDATHFSLTNSLATTPLDPGGSVVASAAMPDCTGTLVRGGADGGRPTVDSSKRCKPWTEKGAFIHR